MMAGVVTILDGPMGTELARARVACPEPAWTAHAVEHASRQVEDLHRAYARAGAQVLTTCTFRARRRYLPETWARVAQRAVELARGAAGSGVRVAGSIAPVFDCWRPDLSPARSDPQATLAEHAELAQLLAETGCDLLLCETFPSTAEGLLATDAALATGTETWLALTPGYRANLLTPRDVAVAARDAAKLGAGAVLVNCCPAMRTLDYVHALADAVGGAVPIGAYANAAGREGALGSAGGADAPKRYADLAERWLAAGATILGGCCGTTPEHTAELSRRFGA